MTDKPSWTQQLDGSFTLGADEYMLLVRETDPHRWAYEVMLRGTLMSIGDFSDYESATKAAEHAVEELSKR